MHQTLHNGMVCGIHVISQWKSAVSHASKGLIARRSQDPIIPAHILEVNICSMLLTGLPTLMVTFVPPSVTSVTSSVAFALIGFAS